MKNSGSIPKFCRTLSQCAPTTSADLAASVQLHIWTSSGKHLRKQLTYFSQLRSHAVYKVPTKVPYHPFNYRMATALFLRVVSRHGKVTMRYWMKPLTTPPGGKRWS
ncbi:hypothetical protein AVEN_220160-1 [Araneus ventricosus]|uniref:Uncharacterized protein n=1 Tax=Araneus ventricosus TaxID=182803 RepID=A0A4Y2TWY3_ARAVE|nr:hypothetical protein AVEN_220160-1 [Araneus ventricosus]